MHIIYEPQLGTTIVMSLLVPITNIIRLSQYLCILLLIYFCTTRVSIHEQLRQIQLDQVHSVNLPYWQNWCFLDCPLEPTASTPVAWLPGSSQVLLASGLAEPECCLAHWEGILSMYQYLSTLLHVFLAVEARMECSVL